MEILMYVCIWERWCMYLCACDCAQQPIILSLRLRHLIIARLFSTDLGWQPPFFDWCCFYYFLRNSLVALLEALFAQVSLQEQRANRRWGSLWVPYSTRWLRKRAFRPSTLLTLASRRRCLQMLAPPHSIHLLRASPAHARKRRGLHIVYISGAFTAACVRRCSRRHIVDTCTVAHSVRRDCCLHIVYIDASVARACRWRCCHMVSTGGEKTDIHRSQEKDSST